ncbi:MAG: chorismate synthase [Fimbriimonadales bacterium]
MGSSFGILFRVSTFGESHGGGVGVVVDGCPPRLPVSHEEIQRELDQAIRPGQSALVTQRKESDLVEILFGIQDGVTLGTPIAMLVRTRTPEGATTKRCAPSVPSEPRRFCVRPEVRDSAVEGGDGLRRGRRSGALRRVPSPKRCCGDSESKSSAGSLRWAKRVPDVDPPTLLLEQVDTPVRCPDPGAAPKMIEDEYSQGGRLGGVVGCVARGVPRAGEPVFDSAGSRPCQGGGDVASRL